MTTKKTKQNSLLNKAIVLGSSLVYLGQGVAGDIVTELEKRNILAGKEGKEVAKQMVAEMTQKREHVKKKIIAELSKVVSSLGVATKKDIERLKKS